MKNNEHDKKNDKKEKFVNKLTSFILSIKMILLTVLILSTVAILSYFIYAEVQKNRLENSTKLIEEYEKTFGTWRTESDVEKKQTVEKELVAKLDTLIKDYGNLYAAQRAYFVKANLYFEKKEWDNALKQYTTLESKFPNSYLTQKSLFEAAACQEELNQVDPALGLYKKIIDKYKDSPLVPNAYFSSGRLYEKQGNFQEAVKMYNALKADFSNSNWTSLAIARIIDLKAQGKI